MEQRFWHGLTVRLGRAIPPLARLHNDRNDLLRQVAELKGQMTAVVANPLASGANSSIASLNPQGPSLDFDYSYHPRVRVWSSAQGNDFFEQLIAKGTQRYLQELAPFAAYKEKFAAISTTEPQDEREPHWGNPWLPTLDAICLSGLVTRLNPRRYVEVGSGNSTKFVRRAIKDHGLRTRIISIDPHPRAVIDSICDEVIRENLENCDLGMFSDLGEEDVLFIDNSHRSFQNSDVTVFFTEILPRLKRGCHYGIHDIFLPNDYPKEWLARFYNEQYLLMAYLLGGAADDEIVLPVQYIQETVALQLPLLPILNIPALSGIKPLGGAFWLKKA